MGKSTRRLGLISSTNTTMNLIITQQIGKKFSYRSRKGEAISTYEIMCISKLAFLNAEIAMELLHSLGMSVDWAENGEVGVKCFNDSPVGEYFAIFMDMQMPVMDGVEAARLIRNAERSDKNIPIFAMTANTFASDRKKCKDVGMSGYIPKPISLKDITDTLKGKAKPL